MLLKHKIYLHFIIYLLLYNYDPTVLKMDMSNQQESDSARLTTSQKAQGMSRSSVVVVGCMVALFVIGIVIIIVVLSLDENDDNDNEIHTSLGDDLWSSYTIFNSLPHTT